MTASWGHIEWNNVCRTVFFWIQPPPPAQLKAVLHYKDAVEGVHHRRPPLTQAFRRVMYVPEPLSAPTTEPTLSPAAAAINAASAVAGTLLLHPLAPTAPR